MQFKQVAMMPLSRQENAMLKHYFENTAPEVLADDELELVSGGVILGPAGGHDLGQAASIQGAKADSLPPQPAGAC
jgi:hypothetical protein